MSGSVLLSGGYHFLNLFTFGCCGSRRRIHLTLLMSVTPKCSVAVLLFAFAGFCISDVSALNCLVGRVGQTQSVAVNPGSVCVAYSFRCTSDDTACTLADVQAGTIKAVAAFTSSETATAMDTMNTVYLAFCKCSGPDNCNVQANNCSASPKSGLFCKYGNSQVNVLSWAGSSGSVVCVSYSETCAVGNKYCTPSMIDSAANITMLTSMAKSTADSYAQMPPAGVTNFCQCATTGCNTGGTCVVAARSNDKSGTSLASSSWTLVAVVSAMLVIMQVV